MQNFTDPAILFFIFGLAAGTVRSNLEIPPQIARFLSLYLLMALGLKGGFALAASGLNTEVATGLACAVALAFVVPTLGYLMLKRIARCQPWCEGGCDPVPDEPPRLFTHLPVADGIKGTGGTNGHHARTAREFAWTFNFL